MLCAHEGDVTLWSRSSETAEVINRERRNPRYLSEFSLPDAIVATADLREAVTGRELVICAVPSHSLRDVMTAAAPHLEPGAVVVSAVKGIEFETGMTMHQVLEDVLEEEQHRRIVCLSGPSFAREIAQRKATVVTLAARDETYAIAVQSTLSCPWFRCYSSGDVLGVEVGGALKNVIAIAVGMGEGLQPSFNTRSALMTRGLAEITRLGVSMGAEPSTFLGLSGMGDLVLTCTATLSRNLRVGIGLGEGRELASILEEMGEVAEGVSTTRAVCRLADRLGVELPIAERVRRVLDGEMTPEQAGAELMSRQLRSEQDDFANLAGAPSAAIGPA